MCFRYNLAFNNRGHKCQSKKEICILLINDFLYKAYYLKCLFWMKKHDLLY